MTPTFDQALAEHGKAGNAIAACTLAAWEAEQGSISNGFRAVAQWVLDNAAAIAEHQSGKQAGGSIEARLAALEKNGGLRKRVQALEWQQVSTEARVEELATRIQALKDANGPRPNEQEMIALCHRVDTFSEMLKALFDANELTPLHTLVWDVALLKDFARWWAGMDPATPTLADKLCGLIESQFGTEFQTPEARKLLGLAAEEPQPDAPPEPEPVYEWVGNDYYFDGKVIGGIVLLFTGEWLPSCSGVRLADTLPCTTEAKARAWVEAQFKQADADPT